VNDAYAALYRYDREAMLGEHWSMLYPDEDLAAVESEILPTVRETGYWRGETTGLRADGARSSRTTLATTEHGELVCSVQDRSDRKARKQAIEALHSTARSFIQAGSVEEVAEIAVDAVRDIPRHPGERDPPLRRRRRRAGAGGLDRPHRGTRRRTPDVRTRRGTGVGDVRERRASGLHRRHDRIGSIQPEDAGTEPDRPPLDDHGVHVIVSPDPDAFDETDVSLLERSRPTRRRPSTASSERELAQQNDRLETFTSVVSHDLRGPLTVAVNEAELARAECESPSLDAADRALDRTATLLDDLQAFARAGAATLDVEPVELAAVCRTSWQQGSTGDATLVTETDAAGCWRTTADCRNCSRTSFATR